MPEAESSDPYRETIVPRLAISLPLRVPEPPGFDVDRPETWPRVPGRLEYVQGALYYMPPCGYEQPVTVADVVNVLVSWRLAHPEFVVGTNEAGMKLGRDVRGADAAIWRTADLPSSPTGGWQRVPPVLAVEVAGLDDTVDLLLEKAAWYLDHDVEVVWIVVPRSREVTVVTATAQTRIGPTETLPEHPSLPELRPRVFELFRQLDR